MSRQNSHNTAPVNITGGRRFIGFAMEFCIILQYITFHCTSDLVIIWLSLFSGHGARWSLPICCPQKNSGIICLPTFAKMESLDIFKTRLKMGYVLFYISSCNIFEHIWSIYMNIFVCNLRNINVIIIIIGCCQTSVNTKRNQEASSEKKVN